MTFEVRVDCTACRVEAARVETWDTESATCRLGIAESSRCRMCGAAGEGRLSYLGSIAPGEGCPGCGAELDQDICDAHRCPFCGTTASFEETGVPRRFEEAESVEVALTNWAREEGLLSTAELLEAFFAYESSEEVFAAMKRGERVETTFDVADYLFSSGASGGASNDGPVSIRIPSDGAEAAPVTLRTYPRGSLPPPPCSPRDELLALASVAAADGEANVDDLGVLSRAANKRSLKPLTSDEIRVWRPNEILPPPGLVDRERLLEEMLQMAWADGQIDESELRVIRGFARSWGIDPERVKEQIELYAMNDAGRIERWLRRIGFFLFPGK